MAVTGVSQPSRNFVFSQIEKIVTSDILRGSESLCRLLRYFGEQSAGHPGTSIKEYQIALDVFGRSQDFDPRLDSTVRVQTGRLRSKLAEYYALEGAADRIVLEIPKGSYSLAVHIRPPQGTVPQRGPAALEAESAQRGSRRFLAVALWALVCVAASLAVALVYVTVWRPAEVASNLGDAAPALRTFWHGFIDTPEQPWVVFSNAEFVGRPETGMRYFDASRDDRAAILDHYTGVGEVLAVHELDRLFGQFRHAIRVKRGRLLSVDDARNNDIIFIGSPTENLTLRDIPTTQEFVFRLADRGPRQGDLGIYNPRPQAGENEAYFGSHAMPLAEDYAVIAVLPGMSPSHWTMILAGTTTIGIQAAVEYVCRNNKVDELLKRVGRSAGGDVMPFEAVIRIRVSRGVPVGSELVAVHTPRS
jgi:hypothetical protein